MRTGKGKNWEEEATVSPSRGSSDQRRENKHELAH